MNDSLTVDRLCDRFEKALREGKAPTIESFLGEVELHLQERLLRELLFLELEGFSKQPKLGDYLARFPKMAGQVTQVFDELGWNNWEGERIGPFEITREIARGGMGVVYLATDTRLDRKVALKMLNRDRRSETRWLRRFRQEARLASSLNHPNIVTIHEIGEDKGLVYLVSEYVAGVTLRQQVERRPLAEAEIIENALQITRGMMVAHAAGVIHRDLKPENLMIRTDGILKIVDFGLAKDFINESEVKSRTGAITGTVHFMSPEQARGQDLSAATDVFSFGTILYYMLTASMPFTGDSISDVLVAILEREPRPLTEFGIGPDSALVALMIQCLSKDPADRPDFEEILATLKQMKSLPLPDEQGDGSADFLLATPAANHDSTSEQALTQVDSHDGLAPSPIRYAQSGDVNIAWQEIGSGPIDIVFVMGWVSHLEWFWKDPSFAKFLRRLATFSRVILFDKRGTGLSDKVPVKELPGLETRMDDVRAVMEAAQSKQAVLCGVSEGGPLCSLFAATFPDKTIALVMMGSYSRRLWAKDYPWGPTQEQREIFLEEIAANWGGPLGLKERAPSESENPRFRDWWASYLRMGASPGAAVALTKMNAQIDILPVLKSILVPTLVIHRTGDQCLRVEEGRYLAENIQGAKFVELAGDDHLPFVGDSESILDEIELFLTELSGGEQTDFVLASVVSIRIPERNELGRIDDFRTTLEEKVELFQGRHFFDGPTWQATFDGPVRSILCSQAIMRIAEQRGIQIGIGIETGTCRIDSHAISGPAVDESRRLAHREHSDSRIVVSPTLKNLISGSTFDFQEFASVESGDASVELYYLEV